MPSVTQIAKIAKQPKGGYLKPSAMTAIQFFDDTPLHPNENIHPSTVGLAVDYLTRYMITADAIEAFKIPLLGASNVHLLPYAHGLIRALDFSLADNTIKAACILASFDVAFRVGPEFYSSNKEPDPNQDTIENIRTMVYRTINYFQIYGPVLKDGFTFNSAYTEIVSSGDGDLLTEHTLWDIKVSKNEPTSKHTLQLLIYFIMAHRTQNPIFRSVSKIGIVNPRLNKIYLYELTESDLPMLKEISKNIIGY